MLLNAPERLERGLNLSKREQLPLSLWLLSAFVSPAARDEGWPKGDKSFSVIVDEKSKMLLSVQVVENVERWKGRVNKSARLTRLMRRSVTLGTIRTSYLDLNLLVCSTSLFFPECTPKPVTTPRAVFLCVPSTEHALRTLTSVEVIFIRSFNLPRERTFQDSLILIFVLIWPFS